MFCGWCHATDIFFSKLWWYEAFGAFSRTAFQSLGRKVALSDTQLVWSGQRAGGHVCAKREKPDGLRGSHSTVLCRQGVLSHRRLWNNC